ESADEKQLKTVLPNLVLDPTADGLHALDIVSPNIEWFSTHNSTASALSVGKLEQALPQWTRLRGLVLTLPLDYQDGQTQQAPFEAAFFHAVAELKQLEYVAIAGHGHCPRSFFARVASNCKRLRLLKVWLYRFHQGPPSSCNATVQDLQLVLDQCPDLRVLDLAPPVVKSILPDDLRRTYLIDGTLGYHWYMDKHRVAAVALDKFDVKLAQERWSNLPHTCVVRLRVSMTEEYHVGRDSY